MCKSLTLLMREPELLKKAKKLRKLGLTYAQIGKVLNLSYHRIDYMLNRERYIKTVLERTRKLKEENLGAWKQSKALAYQRYKPRQRERALERAAERRKEKEAKLEKAKERLSELGFL